MITVTSRSSPPARQVRRVRSLELQGPAGSLEAVLNEGSADTAFAAVIAHPHPQGGGSLHNKVVYHAMKVMNDPQQGLGWPVLRFNFRGTGRSQGVHDGTAEEGDVLAALAWLENEYKLPIVAAGFSFGAAMTLAACCGNAGRQCATIPADADRPQISDTQDAEQTLSPTLADKRGPRRFTPRANAYSGGPRRWGLPNHGAHGVQAMVALGLPVRSGAAQSAAPVYDYSFLAECRIPKLFLSGDNDQFAEKSELIQAVAAAAEPKHVALVPGADHFFTGHLRAMQSELGGWLREQVYDSGQRSSI